MGNNLKNTYAQSNSDSYTYLRDVEDKYLLDSVGDYLMTFYKKENSDMADTKRKYVSIEKLGLYDSKIKQFLAAADEATLGAAKKYADDLAPNYDAAGTAATAANAVQENLATEINRAKDEEARIEGLVTTAQGEIDALEEVVAAKADASALTALSNKVGNVPNDKNVWDTITNIQENAYDDSALQAAVGTLNKTKADKEQVATDIAAAVKTETDNRVEAINAVNSAISGLADTHAKDKSDLLAAIADKADKTALEATNGVLAEVKKDVDDFFKEALTDSDAQQVKNTLREIQDYINSDVEAAAAMAGNIQTNTENIAKLAGETGRVTVLEGKVSTAEGKISGLESALATANGEIAKKVDQTAYDTKVKALEDADSSQVGRIAALEAKFGDGEGNVESQISTAKQEAIDAASADATAKANKALQDAKDYTDAEIDKVETELAKKALASDLTTLAGRVTTAEGNITTLTNGLSDANTNIGNNATAIQGHADRIAALETASAKHALAEDLSNVDKRVQALEAWHKDFIEASEEDINALFPTA